MPIPLACRPTPLCFPCQLAGRCLLRLCPNPIRAGVPRSMFLQEMFPLPMLFPLIADLLPEYHRSFGLRSECPDYLPLNVYPFVNARPLICEKAFSLAPDGEVLSNPM